MTVSPRTFAAILGTLAVVAGLLLLFLPLTTTVNGNPVSCGSPAVASRHAEVGSALASIGHAQVAPIAAIETACASARGGRETGGWVLVGLGVVAVAGATLVRWTSAPTAA